ncbi:MAG: hypothetical protein AB8B51_15150 [Sedimentitalea sp.]
MPDPRRAEHPAEHDFGPLCKAHPDLAALQNACDPTKRHHPGIGNMVKTENDEEGGNQ